MGQMWGRQGGPIGVMSHLIYWIWTFENIYNFYSWYSHLSMMSEPVARVLSSGPQHSLIILMDGLLSSIWWTWTAFCLSSLKSNEWLTPMSVSHLIGAALHTQYPWQQDSVQPVEGTFSDERCQTFLASVKLDLNLVEGYNCHG